MAGGPSDADLDDILNRKSWYVSLTRVLRHTGALNDFEENDHECPATDSELYGHRN
jgi:hypothetical protein